MCVLTPVKVLSSMSVITNFRVPAGGHGHMQPSRQAARNQLVVVMRHCSTAGRAVSGARAARTTWADGQPCTRQLTLQHVLQLISRGMIVGGQTGAGGQGDLVDAQARRRQPRQDGAVDGAHDCGAAADGGLHHGRPVAQVGGVWVGGVGDGVIGSLQGRGVSVGGRGGAA